MRRVLSYAASLDLVTIIHAEDEGLTAGAVATDGEMATRLGLASAPAIAEAMAIARDLALVEETGAPVHFRQVTTARGLDLIRAAKAKGLPVLCGIPPAHLLLPDTAIGDFPTFAPPPPPLRSGDDPPPRLLRPRDRRSDGDRPRPRARRGNRRAGPFPSGDDGARARPHPRRQGQGPSRPVRHHPRAPAALRHRDRRFPHLRAPVAAAPFGG